MRRNRRKRTADTGPESAAPAIPKVLDGVLQICHPDWRGVRASAHAFGDPVLHSADLGRLAAHVDAIADAGAHTVVVQGWPPGAELFSRSASAAGLSVRAVFHSSPAQHGVDPGEAEAVHTMLRLRSDDVIEAVGTVKAGTADAYRALGHRVEYLPNRPPRVEVVAPASLPSDMPNVAVLLARLWRKNLTTQIMAAAQLGWHAYVMDDPGVPYLPEGLVTPLGELERDEYLQHLTAMTVTFNVTHSECHPMIPMESYRLGVPCLMSRTSGLFTDDPELYRLTTVDRHDDPSAIARAAALLVEASPEAVSRANASLDTLDVMAANRWAEFSRG